MKRADPPSLWLAVECARAAARAEFRGQHGLAAGLVAIAQALAAKAAPLSEHRGMVREQNGPLAR